MVSTGGHTSLLLRKRETLFALWLDTVIHWATWVVCARSIVRASQLPPTWNGSNQSIGIDGFALMFLSVIVVARDGNWTPTNGDVYGTFLACVLCHGILASTMSKVMGKLQTVFVIVNFILIFATIIALPIGTKNRNNGHYIFAQTENSTTWPTGWAFMLAWLSPIWTIGAFDSCVHMSEEAANATRAVVCFHPVFTIALHQS